MAIDLDEFINRPEFISRHPETKHFVETALTNLGFALRTLIQELEQKHGSAYDELMHLRHRVHELETENKELKNKLRRPKAEGGKPVAGLKESGPLPPGDIKPAEPPPKESAANPRIQNQIDSRKPPVTATNFGAEDSLGAKLMQAAQKDEMKKSKRRR